MKIIYKDFALEFNPFEALQQALNFFRDNTHAQERFRVTHDFIKDNRSELAQLARFYYSAQGIPLLGGDIPLLVAKQWDLEELIPIQVQDGKLVFTSNREIKRTYPKNRLPLKGSYVSNLIELLYDGDETSSPYEPRLCYRLVNGNKNHELTFSLCDYYDFLNSCEYLMYDFVHKILKKNIFEKYKAGRGNVNIKVDRKCNPFDFSNRYMVPGTNTLLIFLGKEPLMYIHQRSKKTVAEAINVKHVVPAGTFQPIHTDDACHDQDFSLYANVMREFGEELYSDPDIVHPLGQLENIFERPSIAPYHQLVKRGLGKVFYAGFGLDCLNLKPEILTLMVYNKEDFENLFGGINFTPNDEGIPFAVRFTKKNLHRYSRDIKMLPAGAGCMFKAYQNYDVIVNCL